MFFRETESIVCLGAGEKVKNLQGRTAGYRPRAAYRLMVQFQFESCCRQNSLSFLGVKSFFLLRPSTDRMSPTPIMEAICVTHSLLI